MCGMEECERVSNFTPAAEGGSSRNETSGGDHHRCAAHRYTAHRYPQSSSRSPNASMYLLIACVLVILSLTAVDSATIAKRRAVSTEETSGEKEPKECHNNTPCGWAVYIPISRRMDYYIRNVCRCPADKECLKSEDDLSANAYVYRCKVDKNHPINKGND